MLELNQSAVKHMAAMTAAMRTLLADHKKLKPKDLQIVAATGLSESLVNMMLSTALGGCSTLLALFNIESPDTTLEKIFFVDGSTRKDINIGVGRFIQKTNGRFAILSANRDRPYEYAFSRCNRRLVRRAVQGDVDHAFMELNAMRALLAEAASPECRGETFETSYI